MEPTATPRNIAPFLHRRYIRRYALFFLLPLPQVLAGGGGGGGGGGRLSPRAAASPRVPALQTMSFSVDACRNAACTGRPRPGHRTRCRNPRAGAATLAHCQNSDATPGNLHPKHAHTWAPRPTPTISIACRSASLNRDSHNFDFVIFDGERRSRAGGKGVRPSRDVWLRPQLRPANFKARQKAKPRNHPSFRLHRPDARRRL